MIPESRVRPLNDRPIRGDGAFVLHWMNAVRRRRRNFALQHAADLARRLRKPLLIVSDLRLGMPWLSVRHARFLLEGMLCGARARRPRGARFLPLVEERPGAVARAMRTLGAHAAAIVVDDVPWAEAHGLARDLADRVRVSCEAVDAWGLLPMVLAPRVFPTALSFRAFLQKSLLPHLVALPEPDPLANLRLPPLPELPRLAGVRLPGVRELRALIADPASLGIDDAVGPGWAEGGSNAATRRWRAFRDGDLARYGEERNHPDDDASSALSPWLHHGNVGVHVIWADLAARHAWEPDRVGRRVSGRKEGWWGLPAPVEAFLDELVTWRELGANFASRRDDFAAYDSLPAWARLTLEKHARDRRPVLYGRDELEAAATHDEIWNAAQRQLVAEGRLHNYLRMLWGKKILEWTPSPREAVATMIELNNRYALDGQDPNSYSGIFWTLGRYDRPWAPERSIFGTIRYMSSENTRRKLRVKNYLQRFATGAPRRS